MEKAKKFFEEIIKAEEAKALFAATEKPETDEARIAAYLEIAKKLNVELTAEGILAYFDASKPASGELDDDELAQLTGGGEHAECKDTFISGENCWWTDGCDVAATNYADYRCKAGAKIDEFIKSLFS